ncbi:MAG: hypothetical protein NC311_08025 [Muribaculaceae bacterium]|nr:hypothetical protein [Muribaculaceae bacterium]
MENVAIQHINEENLRTYYLNFDENGDKSQELLDILMDSLLEFVFGISSQTTLPLLLSKVHKLTLSTFASVKFVLKDNSHSLTEMYSKYFP